MLVPKISTVLFANAGFCFASALLIVLFPGALAEFVIDLPVTALRILGIGLLLFAVDVFLAARQGPLSRGKVLYIFGADLSWVVLTPVVLLLMQQRVTGLGNSLLVIIALIVASFAALEWLALGQVGNRRGISG
jgi:hypothetical protein